MSMAIGDFRVGGLYIARPSFPLSSYNNRGKLVEINPGSCVMYLGSSCLGDGRGRRWHNFLFEERVVSWCCPTNDYFMDDFWSEAE